jgi:ribosomal protein L37E
MSTGKSTNEADIGRSVMAFCRECGSRLDEEDRFCSSCGVAKGAVAPKPSSAAKAKYGASTTSVAGWIIDILVGWIVGSILGGLLFGIVGFALLGARLDLLGVLVGTIAGIIFMRKRRAAGPRSLEKVEQFSGHRG